MKPTQTSPSAELRSRLDHPIIDSDGHVVEFQPAFLDVLNEVAGRQLTKRYTETYHQKMNEWYSYGEKERISRRIHRASWGILPMKNTLDRATATLPRLLYERLDEMGIDFSILYPSVGPGFIHIDDDEMRRAACRALNTFHAGVYREFADRLTPVALIPMHSPAEAIAELEHAVGSLEMKAIVMASFVLRPRDDGKGYWYDTICLDSEYDYDPVWQKCLDLKVTPTFHSSTKGLGTRASVSNFVFNHIGHFAASAEALCKAAFMGGVTRRFPDLRMVFLEGGVGWACSLFSDLIGHWKKRNKSAMENYNFANLDQKLFWQLHEEFGGSLVAGKLGNQADQEMALYAGSAAFGPTVEHPNLTDDFAQCEITRAEDIRDLFIDSFYFGCEGDDPINAWAFDTRKNPFGARLAAIFGSDISHFDVTDMRIVSAEAHELVEDGLITEDDFRSFVFDNPLKLWTHANPDFFDGTVIEPYSKETP